MKQIGLRVEEEMLAEIERVRGYMPREVLIRKAVADYLRRSHYDTDTQVKSAPAESLESGEDI